MLTIILKRSDEPKVIQMTQEDLVRQMGTLNGAELLLEDSWTEGLRKVRTPLVCLVEADCVLSGGYLSSQVGLMSKTTAKGGGYMKLAMLSSCVGFKTFQNRIYNYKLEQVTNKNLTEWNVRPELNKKSTKLYPVQVGFVPGAVIRYSSIKRDIDNLPWDIPDLIEMSTEISFHLWSTGRRIQVNPNTTYVSGAPEVENPKAFDPAVPSAAANIFIKEQI